MINYVVGFLFSPDRKRVVLIRKNKPEWQKGRLNGVGGKVECSDATWEGAMRREFQEETGALIEPSRWERFADLSNAEVKIVFFRTVGEDVIESKTDEIVAWYPVTKLDKLPVIPNLRWLIPLALDNETKSTLATLA